MAIPVAGVRIVRRPLPFDDGLDAVEHHRPRLLRLFNHRLVRVVLLRDHQHCDFTVLVQIIGDDVMVLGSIWLTDK